MADEETVEQETEEEVDPILAALLADEPEEEYEEEAAEVEAKYAKEDEKVTARLRQVEERLSAEETERKREKAIDHFNSTASQDAKDWLSVMMTGKEDLKQLKGLMELANQKAKTIADEREQEQKEVEERAAQMAAESWGTGPIKGGKTRTLDDEEKEAIEKIAKGDLDTLSSILYNPPQR